MIDGCLQSKNSERNKGKRLSLDKLSNLKSFNKLRKRRLTGLNLSQFSS